MRSTILFDTFCYFDEIRLVIHCVVREAMYRPEYTPKRENTAHIRIAWEKCEEEERIDSSKFTFSFEKLPEIILS